MEVYLSNIITDDDISRIQPGEFNIIRAPRGYGKTTFMFDERILKFARARKHVLYLIHNRATRDSIAQLHGDCAKVFIDNNYNGWFDKRRQGIWTTEEDEDYVHVMCYQTFAALLRNEGVEWLDDIDLIVWDEFDDIKGFYEKEVNVIQKILPNFSKEKLVALLQEGKPNSVVNFVYQIKTLVLDPAKIRLIAISATPECAAYYFRDYLNYVINGKLENKYDAQKTIFINSVIEAIKDGTIRPRDGKKFWCYTKYINDGLAINAMARSAAFTTIVLWSDNNKAHKDLFTQDKKDAIDMITKTGLAPAQYDFIITTGVLGRGVNVYDTSYQDWICNSDTYEDLHQFIRARFSPERQYLLESARGAVEFIQDGFAIDYYEWNTLDQLKELLEKKPIYTQGVEPKRLSTFAAVKKEYPDKFESRKYGRAKTV